VRRVLIASDQALLVEEDDLEGAMRLHAALVAAPPTGVVELVPAARTVLVRFDPTLVDEVSLAKELGSKGILVNAVAPGLVETDMTAGMDTASLVEQIPLRRIGTPADVAGLVAFLCSELGSYITGQVLIIDGGLYT